MDNVFIIDRGRGPEIAGTRITVYHVWEFYGAGESPDEIALTFGLSSRQVAAAIEYIEAHRDEVEVAYAKIKERMRQPPPEWVVEQLNKSRAKFRELLKEKSNQPA